ncbi:uncharacterized protein DUF935 [Chryseobacterium sp. 52]|uniref:phage portal protein family protein n=1 Tax=Chryseobacterium sp. 52 TaxID=2035213 RepID=UPI000C17A3DA|nr:DUF935 family protein [Chryseobacterium sp. 52]PIF44911.1 uncharacterized protein DUF935 [Chryseobacterium sp. 52]
MKKNSKKANLAAKLKPKGSVTSSLQLANSVIPKSISQVRSDVKTWKSAVASFKNADNPKSFPFYNLLADILDDPHLSSQIGNRKRKTLGSTFVIKKASGEVYQEVTDEAERSIWMDEIVGRVLDFNYEGMRLVEFDRKPENDKEGTLIKEPIVTLLPPQNVLPVQGVFLKDYTDDKGIKYREESQFGTWLLELGKPGDLGIVNKLIAKVLFMRFAESCWSELCEIYGIPPRVMKTNTADPASLRRAQTMMKEMGAAAWFIIDETENFEWAKGVDTNGDVYNNLINLCKDSISLLICGAVIGQDTKFGSKGKEDSSQDVLADLVNADKKVVEQYMNTKIIPALFAIGVLPEEGLIFEYEKSEDLGELFTRAIELMKAGKKVPDEWINEKFGIPVEEKEEVTDGKKLNFSANFFD